jgi:hydrogenase expression/formation protein HypC
MCLAVPSKVVELREDNTAVVDTLGVKRVVSLEILQEEVKVGDYVLVHVGFAIQKLNEEEAKKSIELFEEVLRSEGVPDV